MTHRAKVTYRILLVVLLGLTLSAVALILARLALHDGAGVTTTGVMQPADLLVVLAEGVGAAVAAWLALGVSVTTFAALAGVRLPVNLLPSTLRRMVGTMLGLSVVVVAAAPAGAASAPAPSRAASAAASSLDPGWVPSQSAPTSSVTPTGPTLQPRTAPAPRTTQPSHASHSSRSVTVHRGDTLWGIAERQMRAQGTRPSNARVAAAWPRWFAANRATIGSDSDLLRPGTELRTPTTDH